jgi:hypothetical protein
MTAPRMMMMHPTAMAGILKKLHNPFFNMQLPPPPPRVFDVMARESADWKVGAPTPLPLGFWRDGADAGGLHGAAPPRRRRARGGVRAGGVAMGGGRRGESRIPDFKFQIPNPKSQKNSKSPKEQISKGGGAGGAGGMGGETGGEMNFPVEGGGKSPHSIRGGTGAGGAAGEAADWKAGAPRRGGAARNHWNSRLGLNLLH